MSETIGVLALARSTFDVPFAEQMAATAFAAIDAAGIKTVGAFGGGFGEETWRSMQTEQLAATMAQILDRSVAGIRAISRD